jgi:hypothetical protein
MQGFDDQKFKKIKAEKVAIYLSLGFHKGRSSYRRSLQHSKRISSTSKHELFIHFCGSLLLSSGFRIRIDLMRIRIRIQHFF